MVLMVARLVSWIRSLFGMGMVGGTKVLVSGTLGSGPGMYGESRSGKFRSIFEGESTGLDACGRLYFFGGFGFETWGRT